MSRLLFIVVGVIRRGAVFVALVSFAGLLVPAPLALTSAIYLK